MLYLFHGDDTETSRVQADSFLRQLLVKKPDISVFEYDSENWNTAEIEELSLGQGLFIREHVVVIKNMLASLEAEKFILEHLSIFAESAHVFIFMEKKVLAKPLKSFLKYAKKIWKSEHKKATQLGGIKKVVFNPFSLSDAFASRDRKKTWALFCRAIDDEGFAVEQVHGILFSQIKNMLLVKKNSLVNPGLHPFVFQKTKYASKNYSEQELKELSTRFVDLYHDARRGMSDMRASIESLVLKI